MSMPNLSFGCVGRDAVNGFCEDDTSPIGSRAAKLLLTGLSAEAVRAVVAQSRDFATEDECTQTASEVFDWTGGHAGLTAQLCRAMAANGEQAEQCARMIQTQHSELFTIWRERLSPEARAVHDHLVGVKSLSRAEIAQVLARKGLDSLTARVMKSSSLVSVLMSMAGSTCRTACIEKWCLRL
jgi:hypothetical protein